MAWVSREGGNKEISKPYNMCQSKLADLLMSTFLRQFVIPALILVVFLFTLMVVSIRSFLPGDMAQPAPVEPEQMEWVAPT